jgi:hypothetical protein
MGMRQKLIHSWYSPTAEQVELLDWIKSNSDKMPSDGRRTWANVEFSSTSHHNMFVWGEPDDWRERAEKEAAELAEHEAANIRHMEECRVRYEREMWWDRHLWRPLNEIMNLAKSFVVVCLLALPPALMGLLVVNLVNSIDREAKQDKERDLRIEKLERELGQNKKGAEAP